MTMPAINVQAMRATARHEGVLVQVSDLKTSSELVTSLHLTGDEVTRLLHRERTRI
jgi:hypothetical protein